MREKKSQVKEGIFDQEEDVNTIMLRNPIYYAVILPACFCIIPPTVAAAAIWFLQS